MLGLQPNKRYIKKQFEVMFTKMQSDISKEEKTILKKVKKNCVYFDEGPFSNNLH